MKRLVLILFALIGCAIFSNAQVIPGSEDQKMLDSIVEFNYSSQADSIRRSRIDFQYQDAGKHITQIFYRWYAIDQVWLHDYAVLHNKIDVFYDDNGNLLRESRYLWDESTSKFSCLSMMNRNYDGNNLIYEVQEEWDMQGNHIRGHFKNYEYDLDNNLVFNNECDWVDDVSNWWGKYQNTYEYDGWGNQSLYTQLMWNAESREWVEKEKEEWACNEDGVNITYQKFIWDSDSSRWNNTSKYQRELNIDGTWNIENNFSWDNADSSWHQDLRKVRSYDTNGNWTLEITNRYSPAYDSWSEVGKQKRAFNPDESLILDEIYSWDTQKRDWKGYSKRDMSYDESGNQTSINTYIWDLDGWEWLNDKRTEWEHDASGKTISEEKFSWDQMSSSWIGTIKKTWQFDIDENLSSESYYTWQTATNSWEIEKRWFHYYGIPSSVPDISLNENISIYPNPSQGQIYFSGLTESADVKIVSLQGRTLKESKGVENYIDLRELSPGIYFILIQTQGKTQVRKIILE